MSREALHVCALPLLRTVSMWAQNDNTDLSSKGRCTLGTVELP